MKVLIDVEQMKKLLAIAEERGTVDSWIRLAVEWMEEASKTATDMRDRLVTSEAELSEYKLCTDVGNEHRKVKKLERKLELQQPVIDAAIVWAECPETGGYEDGPGMEDTCEELLSAVETYKTNIRNSSAERLQEKVVCEVCEGKGKLYSNNMVYPCMSCNEWYRGSR